MAAKSSSRRGCFNKKHAATPSALAHADQAQRTALLRKADPAFVGCICEVALNTLHGYLPIREGAKKKLRKHACVLLRLAKQSESVGKKKKILLQSGGGFLPALIAPLLVELATRLLTRNPSSSGEKNGTSSKSHSATG